MAVFAIFRIRRDTAANWTAANPVLKLGEPGLETNTRRVKYGDGVTAWNALAYSSAVVAWADVSGVPASLSTIAGLVPAADRLPYYTGAGAAALATFTAAGRALVDDADATAQRATLGLGTIATQAANNVAITGGSALNLTTVTVDQASNSSSGDQTTYGFRLTVAGAQGFALGSDAVNVYAQSFDGKTLNLNFLGNPTRVGGTLAVAGHGTTANGANAYIDPTTGLVSRSTSSLAYKRDVEDMRPEDADDIVRNVRPIWYRSALENDPGGWSWWGLGAEQVAEIDPRLAQWGYVPEDYDGRYKLAKVLKANAKPRPVGVDYARFVVPLLSVVQRLEERLAAAEQEIARLKKKAGE